MTDITAHSIIKAASIMTFLERRVPSVYQIVDIVDSLVPRIWDRVRGKKVDREKYSSRDRAYARSQKLFDDLVPNEDMINIAPIPEGEPLLNVQDSDHDELRRLGALQQEEKWLMPRDLSVEETWQFIKWFPRAPADLKLLGTNTILRRDGRSTIGYILSEDRRMGGDSTATSVVMGMFPILFAIAATIFAIPYAGPAVVMGVIIPVLIILSITLFQAEGIGTLVKLLLLSGGIPLIIGGKSFFEGGTFSLGSGTSAYEGIAIIIVVFMIASALKPRNDGTPILPLSARLLNGLLIISVVSGLNFLLFLLPDTFAGLRSLGLHIVACAFPMVYTLENHLSRASELKDQNLTLGGKRQSVNSMLGPTAPMRMSQIRSAARDTSEFMPEGKALGIMAQSDLCIAPQKGQMLGGTLEDKRMHSLILGFTGSMKTAGSIRRKMLNLSKLSQAIGAVGMDGKGAMINDTREWWDIVIEPGIKLAPFMGLNSQQVAQAFAEANNEDMDDKGSLWVQGAGRFHRYCLAVLEALIFVQNQQIEDSKKRLDLAKIEITYKLAESERDSRQGKNTDAIDRELETAMANARALIDQIQAKPTYRWTPVAYSKLKNTLSVPVEVKGMKRPNPKALALFQYLGMDISAYQEDGFIDQEIRVDQAKALTDPSAIHPHLYDDTRVLVNALVYFTKEFISLGPDQLNSFLMNVNKDIGGFMQSDELRGSMIDGKDCGEQSWSDTEVGVDILQALYGKKVGINLSAEGQTEKIIMKLLELRVDKAIRERKKVDPEKFSSWMEAFPGQTIVFKIVDEMQDLVSPMDEKMIGVGRSLGYSMIMATQTIDILGKVLKTQNALTGFLSNFRNYTVYQCSEATYEFIQGIVGEAVMRKLPTSVEAVIDTDRAIDIYDSSIFRDPDHPNAIVLRDLDRRGATRMQVVRRGMQGFNGLARKTKIDDMDQRNYLSVDAGAVYEKGPILEKHMMTENLDMEGHALMVLNRAGHRRIDFVKMEHISTTEFAAQLKAINERKSFDAINKDIQNVVHLAQNTI